MGDDAVILSEAERELADRLVEAARTLGGYQTASALASATGVRTRDTWRAFDYLVHEKYLVVRPNGCGTSIRRRNEAEEEQMAQGGADHVHRSHSYGEEPGSRAFSALRRSIHDGCDLRRILFVAESHRGRRG
jgi:hypothetical protein